MISIADPTVYQITAMARALLATSAGLLVLGLSVLHRESYSALSRAFFLAVAAALIWLMAFSAMYSSVDPDVALIWSRAAYLGVPFIPAAITSFAIQLAGLRRPRLVSLLWVASAIFSVGFLTSNHFIASIQRFDWGFYPRYGAGGLVFVLYFAAVLGYVMGLFWRGMHEAAGPRQRARYRAFLIAFALAYVGAVDYLGKFGFAVYPLGFAAIAAFLATCAWAHWRYRLVDITPAFAAEKILETVQAAVVVTDFYGTVRVMNNAAAVLFGRGPTEIIGRTLRNCGLHLAPRVGSEPPSVPYRGFPSSLRRADGTRVEVDVSAAWLDDSAGTRIGIVYVATDVSGRLREASELARSTAEKDQLEIFASIAAHDLRKPLNHIGSFADLAEMALQDGDAPTSSRYLGRIREAATRLQRLLDGLLRYERALLTGGEETRVDLNAVLADVRASLPDLDRGDAIEVGALPEIKGMPVQLRQLFENLILNALKFRHPERPLRVGVQAVITFGEVRITVRDNGIGFRREDARRIFLPFERLEAAVNREGQGLGLAICRRIATHHGGRIEAKSEPGEGTEFTIILPAERVIRNSTGSAA